MSSPAGLLLVTVAGVALLVVLNHIAYVSGTGPSRADGTFITGRVGADLTLAEGRAAARQVGLTILAQLQANLGSLNRVKRLVKSLGMVNATAEFSQHPQVINGYSELMAEVFGSEAGVGAGRCGAGRAAAGRGGGVT